MQRSLALTGIIVVLATVFHVSCAEQKNIRVINRLSFSEAAISTDAYIKKVAILDSIDSGNTFNGQAANTLTQTLINTVQSETDSIDLVIPQDSDFSSILRNVNIEDNPGQRSAIFSMARDQDYFAVIQAKVLSISPYQKKTGILFFRKMRSFITVTLVADTYSAVTYAKLSSIVKSETVNVDTILYEDFMAGNPNSIPEVDEAIEDLAEDLGEDAARSISDARWMTTVLDMQNGRVTLASGASAGLQKADRLVVFEGQRTESGPDGEKYVIPGYKLAEIRLGGFGGGHAYAKIGADINIKPGDIAVVLK